MNSKSTCVQGEMNVEDDGVVTRGVMDVRNLLEGISEDHERVRSEADELWLCH